MKRPPCWNNNLKVRNLSSHIILGVMVSNMTNNIKLLFVSWSVEERREDERREERRKGFL